ILLAEERLVYVVPQVGTVVAPILSAEIETAQFVRESLELAALTESLSRATAEDVAALSAIVDAQRIAESRRSLSGFFTLDEEFHATLMAVSGHGSAWRTVAQAKSHLDRARHLSLTVEGMHQLIIEHQKIVDGLAAGDAEAALQAMRAHLRRVFEDIAAVRTTRPELFTA
ncbi:MAG: GntR family transcriptional regulator, partial [Microbacteriaceae bacterium]